MAASDNVIPGRDWRPSSLTGGPDRGQSAQSPSCAAWLCHAVTVTSFSRMRSSSVRLELEIDQRHTPGVTENGYSGVATLPDLATVGAAPAKSVQKGKLRR